MKTLQVIIGALILLTPMAAIADDAHAARTKAREETIEALETYKKVLENELRQLDSWAATLEGPGGKSLRDERELAKKKLDQITEEAKRSWDGTRARMDDIIDDLKRRSREGRARPGASDLLDDKRKPLRLTDDHRTIHRNFAAADACVPQLAAHANETRGRQVIHGRCTPPDRTEVAGARNAARIAGYSARSLPT